jgi:filamentous hemagglutinin family protein
MPVKPANKNRLFYSNYVLCLVLNFTYSYSAFAQIVPDTTLPVNSLVTPQGNTSIITGGTTAGSNLFHSFEQFSISTGSSAFFDNAPNIQNIISRVTGGSISNIDGLIRANDTANFFLLNPNGIIFGPNALLNIGGSFLGSTASSLNFADGTQFSTKTPQSEPLLTVSVPIGLGFTGNPGSINVQGTGHTQFVYGNQVAASITLSGPGESQNGLRLQPGKTLALVGGDVSFKGGVATAPSGRIEIGSIDFGVVELTPKIFGWNLSYEEVNSFKDIRLAEQSLLDASGNMAGDIHIQGRNINFTDGSLALIANSGFFDSGAIRIDALETLDMTGITAFNTANFGFGNQRINRGLITMTFWGKGADVIISTKRLIGRASEGIALLTFGSGNSGNLTINSSDSVKILGTSDYEGSAISTVFSTGTYGSGQAGDVSLSTRKLFLEDGGTLQSLTFSSGQGGNVTVNASEFVKILGGQSVDVLVAKDSNDTVPGFSPSSLLSQSISSGKAGNIVVNTRQLAIENGGRLAASVLASGNAGSVTINASDSVDVRGSSPVNQSLNPSIITSSVNIVDPYLNFIYDISQRPDASSGNVTINTGRLSLRDGAQVTVQNDGRGDAGTLRIKATSINLDSQAGITASTQSGRGGDISINSRGLLLLRNNGKISAEAGGTGDGGNITINIPFIVAIPQEDSDIIANAFKGRGGNIDITASGIFGIQPRNQNTLQSDITASSQLGINGTVQINTLDVNPSQELANLPEEPVDATGLIAQGCSAGVGPAASRFVVTGRGGIPDNPNETLNSDTLWTDSRLITSTENQASSPSAAQPTEPASAPLVEANSWKINAKGEVVLTATAPSIEVPWMTATSCHAS